MATDGTPLRIAVIGGGVAGIVAAYLLSRHHSVTLFEKNDYLGGHTNTLVIGAGPDQGLAVDTGFIVCNSVNYPNFYRFLDQLEVRRRNSDMRFGFFCEHTGFTYNAPMASALLAEPLNFFRADFLSMLWDRHRFNKLAIQGLKEGTLTETTLGDFLSRGEFTQFFVQNYIVPLAAAIWSSPATDMFEFPALTFLRFFDNHGILDLKKLPQWQTIVGGSHRYVQAFSKKYAGVVCLESGVKKVERTGAEVRVIAKASATFDKVVFATHADTTLGLLASPTAEEQNLLGSWRYNTSRAVLHTDISLLPPKRRLWASWNYFRPRETSAGDPVPVSYYMNRLQGLKSEHDYIVTLNRCAKINESKIIKEIDYDHPVYTPRSVASQEGLRRINGSNNTYFCGSYTGYGFHEDAVSSAVEVGSKFGISL